MDELCLHWSQVAERRGGGVLRHPGMDSASCCVVLAATADGNAFSFSIILPASPAPRVLVAADPVLARVCRSWFKMRLLQR